MLMFTKAVTGMKQNKIIGITGGSGSGKSAASSILKNKSAYLIDADGVAHDIIKKGMPAYHEIIDCFGSTILNELFEIDRKKLASIVFKDKSKLVILNNITHKYIIDSIKNDIEKNIYNIKYKYIVLDAPLLIETGLYKLADTVWLIYADFETRISRIMKRDSISRLAASDRINSQTPFDELQKYADVIINNNSDDLNILEKNISSALNDL